MERRSSLSESSSPSRERTPAEIRSLRQAAQMVAMAREEPVEHRRGPEEFRSMRLAATLLTMHLLLGTTHYFLTESHPPALIWFALPVILALALYTLSSFVQVIVIIMIVIVCGVGPVFYLSTAPGQEALPQILALWGGAIPVLLLLNGRQSPSRRTVSVVLFLLFTCTFYALRIFSALAQP
jgi:hypothetical protein